MNGSEFGLLLDAARAFLRLNLPTDAWEKIEELPLTRRRLHPDVTALRLLILAKLKKWELGTRYLDTVTADSHVDCRAAAGAYLLAHAVDMCDDGRMETARATMRMAATLYPEGRELATGSPALLSIWP